MRLFFSVTLFILLLLVPQTTLASTFTLWKIGTVPTEGKRYNQFWYTGNYPTLYGTTEANKTVHIEVDGYPITTLAEGNGNWSYKLDTLDSGDHTIRISVDDDNYQFILSLGEKGATLVASDSATLPIAGANPLYFALIGSGLIVAGGYTMRKWYMPSYPIS